MQKITPFLWFDGNAEEAISLYTSVFRNSRLLNVTRCGELGPGPKGSVLTATFQLEGQQFMALNGGPKFRFSPAISLFVSCESQQEVDDLWTKLSAGGAEERCGWLRDKFGVSWQIIPSELGTLMSDEDPARAGNVMRAVLEMDRIDIRKLRRAHAHS